jgi:hypothetical protein
MRCHVDEGGQLSHRNWLDLLAEVERLSVRPMAADIAQIIRQGYAGGKTMDEIAEAVLREMEP